MGYLMGVEATGAYGRQTYYLPIQIVLRIEESKPVVDLRACPGLQCDSFCTAIPATMAVASVAD